MSSMPRGFQNGGKISMSLRYVAVSNISLTMNFKTGASLRLGPGNKITPSHNHATLLLHNKGIFQQTPRSWQKHLCFFSMETNFDVFKSCLSIYSGTSIQGTPWGRKQVSLNRGWAGGLLIINQQIKYKIKY